MRILSEEVSIAFQILRARRSQVTGKIKAQMSIASALLGTMADGDDMDQYADFDKSCELCEQCAETGYQILLKKYNDAGCDEELLERRMLTELDMLYSKNVLEDLG